MIKMAVVSRWPAHGTATALIEAISPYIIGSQPQLTNIQWGHRKLVRSVLIVVFAAITALYNSVNYVLLDPT